MPGADLKAVLYTARQTALKNGVDTNDKISTEMFIDAIQETKPSVSPAELNKYQNV